MGIRYKGEVIFVRKNYGFLITEIDSEKVRLFFIVKKEMIDNNLFILGKNVSFEVRNMTIRGTNIVEAYALKSSVSEISPIKIEDNLNVESINEFGYRSVYGNEKDFNDTINNNLLAKEKEVNMFLLNWILFLENETKKIIKYTLEQAHIDTYHFLEKLKKTSKAKKIIFESLKKLKENTIFRPESDSIDYIVNEADPNDVNIENCPLLMLLEQLSINELSLILNICKTEYAKFLSNDLQTLMIFLTELLPDVIFIRNKIAHGNIVIPLILDDSFSPSYFYEMANVFPQWNSNDNLNDVEKYPAFDFIRFQSRMMAKEGINLAGIHSGPMMIGLFFTKSLLINQAKKSFFSFFFLLMSIFSYWEKGMYKKFIDEFVKSGIMCFQSTPKSVFSTYPDYARSVEFGLSTILMPIFHLCSTPESFKVYTSISLNLNRNNFESKQL